MDLLNLDDLVHDRRSVQLFGNTYYIHEQTLGQLITATQMKKRSDKDDDEAMIAGMMETAKSLLPDAPEADLRKLNLTQLTALVEFASASDHELAASVADDDGSVEDGSEPDSPKA